MIWWWDWSCGVFVIFLWWVESTVLWGRARLDRFVLVWRFWIVFIDEKKEKKHCGYGFLGFVLSLCGILWFGFFSGVWFDHLVCELKWDISEMGVKSRGLWVLLWCYRFFVCIQIWVIDCSFCFFPWRKSQVLSSWNSQFPDTSHLQGSCPSIYTMSWICMRMDVLIVHLVCILDIVLSSRKERRGDLMSGFCFSSFGKFPLF